MYKLLKAYCYEFNEDFPFSKVSGLTEYQICRIIQSCLAEHKAYSAEEGDGEPENNPTVDIPPAEE